MLGMSTSRLAALRRTVLSGLANQHQSAGVIGCSPLSFRKAAARDQLRRGNAASAASTSAENKSNLRPFQLERFFAEYEFTAPHLLCCSDCEPLSLSELLSMGDDESISRYEDLSLGYTESQGLPALRDEVAALYETVSPDDVIICAPEEGIFLAMTCLLGPGDNVIVTHPGYQSLSEIAIGRGASVTYWTPRAEESGGLRFAVDDLEALLASNAEAGGTRLVITNFPHNPTGLLLEHDEWARVTALTESHGATLFSDEMYRGLEYDPKDQLPSAVDSCKDALALGGMSKTYSLPGLRLGWVLTKNHELRDAMVQTKDYTTICASAPSEVLALMGLRARDQIVAKNLAQIAANREAIVQLLDSFPGRFQWLPPRAGSTAFPRLVDGSDVDRFCRETVENCGVLLLPATVYEHEPTTAAGHFRVGLGRKDVSESLEVLSKYLSSRE